MNGVVAAAASVPLADGQGALSLVLAVMVPVIGMLAIVVFGGRQAERIGIAVAAADLLTAAVVATQVGRGGAAISYIPGGFAPPLGLSLRADGISAVMLVISSIVMLAAALYAGPAFRTGAGEPEARKPIVFWLSMLGVAAGLNLVFVSGDLFNLYVALELLTFSAVPLVSLDGRPAVLVAALRYLLFALAGSVLYLLGAALLFGAYGTLDIALIAHASRPEPVLWIALAAMTAGLLAKTALFPLHLWLPPAHAGAPPAASAVLSALVVKGSFFIIVRLWFDVMPLPGSVAGAQMLAALGAAAIMVGSAVALRQVRLKGLIAYSTIAQLGYLFFLFPLAGGGAAAWSGLAWTAGFLQLAAHAFAKAAMFMSAGLLAEAFGHDRIDGLRGAARALPVTTLAFALAGLSLMGLPPSGGFSAKWLLLQASVNAGQWLWAVVILAGGLFAAGYVFRVLAISLAPVNDGGGPLRSVARPRAAVALTLALLAVLLGFLPLRDQPFLHIGRGPLPQAATAAQAVAEAAR